MASDFALAMMKKMGWSEGKGLGKDEDGRTSAILPTQKQDVKGLGFGTEGAFKSWWDDLYNNTAVTIKVKDNKKSKNKETRKDKKSKKSKKSKESEKSKKSKKDKHKKNKESKLKVSKESEKSSKKSKK